MSNEAENKPDPIKSREKPAIPDLPLWKAMGLQEERGKPVINADNLQRVLEHDPLLENGIWYDGFHDKIFSIIDRNANMNGHASEFTDTENLHLLTYMQNTLGITRASKEMLRDAVTAHAYRNQRNEVKDWLDTLGHDGSPRIDNFMSDALGAEPSIYSRAVSKNFWISLVARVYRPGCQVDNMIVLEGPQGIGKTRALRAIGGKWYAEASASIQDKDFYLALQGKILIEIGELESFSKADVTKIKSAITCLNDRYRSPYDTTSKDHPRQCVFAGTTNETKWAKDQTGARRFWPIKCDLIDVEYILKNRDQLYAEAITRFKADETWYEMPESTLLEQEARRASDAWEEPIAQWLVTQPQGGLILSDVANQALGITIDRFNMMEQKRLAQAMRRAGWEVRHTREGNLWYKCEAS